MNVQKKEKGFTIIEVVLVLAIAALIFLMIFVALPALQRNQANGARKNDVGVIVSALGTFRTNNRGAAPTTAAQVNKYLDGGLARLENPEFRQKGSGGVTTTDETSLDKSYVYLSSQCDDDLAQQNTPVPAGSRQQAVVTLIEVTSGSYEAYCQNS